jgi:hypothetical protein
MMVVGRMFGIAALLVAAPLAAQIVTPAPAPTPAPSTPAAAPIGKAMIITPGKAGQVALPGAPPPPKAAGPGEVSRNAPIDGVLVLFGNEKCPTDTQGNEIVVCSRRGANEQFRIPKEMRDFKVTPENAAWAAKLQPVLTAGDSGIGSCTTVGPGGSTGCMTQQFQAARAENQARKKEEAEAP